MYVHQPIYILHADSSGATIWNIHCRKKWWDATQTDADAANSVHGTSVRVAVSCYVAFHKRRENNVTTEHSLAILYMGKHCPQCIGVHSPRASLSALCSDNLQQKSTYDESP
mmetsp:Transcript_10659/g.23450  ORF Transcript_10659/g.23450 Transcript_10659/m.23450 type:complete len:112 (-) Transcript_10659:1344-1679(-)